MGVVLSRDDSGNIKAAYPYNPDYVSKIKTVPGRTRGQEGSAIDIGQEIKAK